MTKLERKGFKDDLIDTFSIDIFTFAAFAHGGNISFLAENYS